MFKTKTFIFVLEEPRDQDPGLEDYITKEQRGCAVQMSEFLTCSEVIETVLYWCKGEIIDGKVIRYRINDD